MTAPGSTTSVVQIQVALPSPEHAEELCEALLSARLAACCQVLGPMTSRFRWKGALEQATEWLMLVKTTEQATEEAIAMIELLHPYETPEILVTAVLGGAAPYLEWLLAQTSRTSDP